MWAVAVGRSAWSRRYVAAQQRHAADSRHRMSLINVESALAADAGRYAAYSYRVNNMKLYEQSVEIPSPLGGQWRLRKLTELTVLFGKNGSGKSLLLRSWRDAHVRVAHYVIPERSGDIGFNPSYMQEQLDPNQRRDRFSRNYFSEYRQSIVSRVQGYFLARGSTRGEQLPGDPAEIESLLNQLLPDFVVGIHGANPPYKLTRFGSEQIVTSVDQLSSGEAQLLTIGLDILTMAAIWDIENASQRLLLIDEPDAHIHPDLQARFADFLVRTATRFKLQVVVATHSTTLLSALGQFGGTKTSVIYLDRMKEEFVASPFTAILKELASCLGGHVLMGTLFGVPLLLVEGDDDYRIWSQVPRHHVVNFAVIPCEGEEIKTYQKTLEGILGSIRDTSIEPVGYALLDGDKGLPMVNENNTQKHIRFLKLNCHEAENLFLTDEVLAQLNLNWTDAVAKIVSGSSGCGNKAEILASATSWDRQWSDIKNLINEISRILDPKNVHWTIRVGTAIGRNVPTGQLASFLGEDVLEALWHLPKPAGELESPAA